LKSSGILCWCCVPQPQISGWSSRMCLICTLHLASINLLVWLMYTFPYLQGIQESIHRPDWEVYRG
jgi:hypothetical protein